MEGLVNQTESEDNGSNFSIWLSIEMAAPYNVANCIDFYKSMQFGS